jgi:hypothetical protein
VRRKDRDSTQYGENKDSPEEAKPNKVAGFLFWRLLFGCHIEVLFLSVLIQDRVPTPIMVAFFKLFE